MRIAGLAPILTILLLAACSADRLTNVGRVLPPPPHTTINPDFAFLLNNSGSPANNFTVGGINEPGVVVGSLTDGSSQVATIWSPPDYKPEALPLPGDTGISIGTRIANDGTVLGKICDSAVQHCRWVTWKNGTITPVDPQGDARDICPCDGQVIGGGLMVDGVQHPVIWTHGKVLDLGVPPGFVSAEVIAVDEGFMAVTAVRARGGRAPFRWSPQFGYQTLPVTGGDVGAIDVNALGTVLADDDHVYPLGGPAIAFPEINGTLAFADGTAISDSNWVSGRWTLRPPDALPPPTAGAWKVGTDTVVSLGGYFDEGIDVNNSGLVLGLATAGNIGSPVNEAWVQDIH